MVMLKPRWSRIKDIPCQATRVALIACSDPPTAERLYAAFPECFYNPDEEALDAAPVPFSEIVRRTREHLTMQDYDDPVAVAPYEWLKAAEDLNLPVIGWDDRENTYVPAELVRQLRGLTLSGPLFVEYQGAQWVVCGSYIAGEGAITDGVSIPANADVEELRIVPASYIDFNA